MPLVVSAIDYTIVISSVIAGLSSIVAAVGAAYVARQIRTPSGDSIGKVAERTHDNSITTSIGVTHLVEQLSGDVRDNVSAED